MTNCQTVHYFYNNIRLLESQRMIGLILDRHPPAGTLQANTGQRYEILPTAA